MRRWALAVLAATLAPVATAAAETPEIVRGPYLVADAETGQIITDFDAVRPWFPASTTKLMTIYVTFQAIRAGEIALSDEIVYSANAAAQPPSKMGFRPGATLTLDHALKMMMVKSANDVAVSVAEAVGGSVEDFAARMNETAAALGMSGSHFTNPHGLPDAAQVTTARDMALLAQALLSEFSEHRPYYAIHAIQIGDKVLRNYNRLIHRFPGTTGMKTGFICSSGYNLVASASRDGRELIAVVFGEYGGKLRNAHAAELLAEAFKTRLRVESETTLLNVRSGDTYTEALDMRPSVCGPKRAAVLAALQADGGDASGHMDTPIDNGPPVRVAAYIPPVYGEAAFVAPLPRPRPILAEDAEPIMLTRLPRPRPDEETPDHLEAFAPIEAGAGLSAPAEAIGAAAGAPHPLEEVAPE